MKYVLILLAVALAANADETPVTFHGFVDGVYAWNTNEPHSHDSFVPGTGTSAKHANQFDLNLAEIEIARDAQPLGFHLSLVEGSGEEVVHSADPHPYRHVYQASILYKSSDRLTFEAGIFPSHIGFEGFYSKDNWNYTRGWLGEFSPYYQTGVHATVRFNDHWSGEIHVLNGWQIVGENNDAKAIGAKIAYSNDRLSTSLNTFDGPELPNDNKDWRHFGDLIATYKATKTLTLGGSLDRGRQAFPDRAAANWLGIAAYARYTLDDKRAIAVRFERFSDPHNGITGAPQKLDEATLTYEHRPVSNLILKLEARRDRSTAPVFTKGESGTSRDETIVVASAVATF